MIEEKEHRRRAYTEEELDVIAASISARLGDQGCTAFTKDQQQAIIGLIAQKKRVVRGTLWIIGALVLWALKDLYMWIVNHLSIGWGGN